MEFGVEENHKSYASGIRKNTFSLLSSNFSSFFAFGLLTHLHIVLFLCLFSSFSLFPFLFSVVKANGVIKAWDWSETGFLWIFNWYLFSPIQVSLSRFYTSLSSTSCQKFLLAARLKTEIVQIFKRRQTKPDHSQRFSFEICAKASASKSDSLFPHKT